MGSTTRTWCAGGAEEIRDVEWHRISAIVIDADRPETRSWPRSGRRSGRGLKGKGGPAHRRAPEDPSAGGREPHQEGVAELGRPGSEPAPRAVVGFVVNPILVRYLGDVSFGEWQVLYRLVGQTNPAGGRPSEALKWFIAHRQSSDDLHAKREAVGSSIVVWLIFLPFLVVIGGVVAWFAPVWLDVTPADQGQVRLAGAVLVLGIVVMGLANIPMGGAHRPEPRLQAHGHDLGHRVRRRRPDDRRRGARGGARRPGRRDRHDDRAERFALPVAGPQVHPVVRRREARSRGDAQVPGAELVVPAVERGDEDHDGWRRVVLGIAGNASEGHELLVDPVHPAHDHGDGRQHDLRHGARARRGDRRRRPRPAKRVRSETMSIAWLMAAVAGAGVLLWERSFLDLWVGRRFYPACSRPC